MIWLIFMGIAFPFSGHLNIFLQILNDRAKLESRPPSYGYLPAVAYSVFLVHTLELLNLSGFKWPHIWESQQGRWYCASVFSIASCWLQPRLGQGIISQTMRSQIIWVSEEGNLFPVWVTGTSRSLRENKMEVVLAAGPWSPIEETVIVIGWT